MDARLRGLVHAPDRIDAGRLEPHQEWRPVSDGRHRPDDRFVMSAA